eukprot:1383313-Pyramimonas_sp.AAC.1
MILKPKGPIFVDSDHHKGRYSNCIHGAACTRKVGAFKRKWHMRVVVSAPMIAPDAPTAGLGHM